MTLPQRLIAYIAYTVHLFRAETMGMLVSHSYIPPAKASNIRCRLRICLHPAYTLHAPDERDQPTLITAVVWARCRSSVGKSIHQHQLTLVSLS